MIRLRESDYSYHIIVLSVIFAFRHQFTPSIFYFIYILLFIFHVLLLLMVLMTNVLFYCTCMAIFTVYI